jgi:hypothetical protein
MHGPNAKRQVELDNAVATILVGEFAGAASSARRDTELVGVDVALGPGTGVWPLAPAFCSRAAPPRSADAEGRQWPRTKRSDDATPVYLVLS